MVVFPSAKVVIPETSYYQTLITFFLFVQCSLLKTYPKEIDLNKKCDILNFQLVSHID